MAEESLPPFGLATRLRDRDRDASWAAVLVSPEQAEEYAADLRTESNIYFGREPDVVATLEWNEADWRHFDLRRERVAKKSPVVLLVNDDGLAALAEWAPNIRSYIGSSIYACGPNFQPLTDQEREQRLQQLRGEFALSDDELIRRRVEDGVTLNPLQAEWLVLLDRADLL